MRVSVLDVGRMKRRREPIVVLTAYDCPMARLVDAAGVPIVLVGDTVGMVVLGYESTVRVTVEEMLHHTAAVVRGTERAMVVGDLPFASYRSGADEAVRVAARFLREAGAQAVKLEGGRDVEDVVARLVAAGIPVMGHVGLTPQSVYRLGGYRVQGKTAAAIAALISDAEAVERAGAFAVVLECVPAEVAHEITRRLHIPTIGIGAGPHCDGQVQVLTDILGLTAGALPRHARLFADVAAAVRSGVEAYRDAVRSGTFPSPAESSAVAAGELDAWRRAQSGPGAAASAPAVGQPAPGGSAPEPERGVPQDDAAWG